MFDEIPQQNDSIYATRNETLKNLGMWIFVFQKCGKF